MRKTGTEKQRESDIQTDRHAYIHTQRERKAETRAHSKRGQLRQRHKV